MPAVQEQIPQEILEAYGLEADACAHRLSDGLVNRTFRVTTSNGDTILQRVSPELHPEAYKDIVVVTNHLRQAKLETPYLLPTVSGQLVVVDRAGIQWRSTSFIESDGAVPSDSSPRLMHEAGALVGRWHRATSDLNYKPAYGIPHFHDTPFYVRKLRENLDQLDATGKELGEALIAIAVASSTPNEQPQVIHGDPKLANMLYRDSIPTVVVDPDTLMHGSIYTDIGDFSRSAIARDIHAKKFKSVEIIGQFMEGYREQNPSTIQWGDALRKAKDSTVRIAAELGIRYLCDIHGKYFQWGGDQTHESRRDKHYERARLQLLVAEVVGQATIRDMMGEK